MKSILRIKFDTIVVITVGISQYLADKKWDSLLALAVKYEYPSWYDSHILTDVYCIYLK